MHFARVSGIQTLRAASTSYNLWRPSGIMVSVFCRLRHTIGTVLPAASLASARRTEAPVHVLDVARAALPGGHDLDTVNL